MKPLLLLPLLLSLAACGSAPAVRYYTLVRPLDTNAPRQGLSGVDVISVRVPAAADHPQLVVRQGAERVELVETHQWIAPLPDEIRAGLTERLDARVPRGSELLKLSLEVTRFESVLDQYALIETHWELRSKKGEALNCVSRSVQTVGAGFDALIAGHQRALDRVADDIAAAARRYADTGAQCPAVAS